MNQNLSPEAEKLLIKFQTLQQQFQAVAIQKETFTVQKNEVSKALDELEKSDSGDVYKSVGPIIIKTEKAELTKDLKEKLETFDLRLKTLNSQEEKFKEKLKENQEEIQKALTAVAQVQEDTKKDEDKSIA
jgi:prefoldin beta subunit